MVEALDRNFKNVCELDIIFNVEQVQSVSQSFSSAPHTAPLCWVLEAQYRGIVELSRGG